MNDFMSRLDDEKNELEQKVDKLIDFLFTAEFDRIDHVQKGLLHIQLCAMQTYLKCLKERTENLNQH